MTTSAVPKTDLHQSAAAYASESFQETLDAATVTVTVTSEPIVERLLLPGTSGHPPAPSEDSEAPRYDPELIEAYYEHQTVKVILRFFAIFWPLLSFFLGLWWDQRTNQWPKTQQKRAIELRELLTRLGPAFVKVGQALSTRPDLVPLIVLEELTRLQDQLPAFPNEVAYQFIQEELGGHPNEIYAELSASPIAAASLGQVYKGRLKTGEVVAVKVQRPGLDRSISLDLYIMRKLAAWTMRTVKRIRSDLVGILDEFGERIFEEMDYVHEGRNAERFAQLYGHLPEIYVPTIYWNYTRRRVLTMEWVTGTKLTQAEAIQKQGINATHLIEVGVQCSLRQLLEHGFFHADPHPGNLLATPDGKLAYLDFGMMSEVKVSQRYGLIEAVVHLVNRDFEGLAKDYVKLEFLTPDTDLRPIVPAFANVFGNALGASVAELNFKSITNQLSEIMYEYPFRVPAYYALIIRSLVTLEGIAINIDPNFKVLSKAYPYVAKRLLTDNSPELRTSLRDLLFKDNSFRWNRLENLLRNARNNPGYDVNQVLQQTIDFLLSERGTFIRDQLVEELVRAVDNASRQLWQSFGHQVGQFFGGPSAPAMTVAAPDVKTLENLQRIWGILQESPGFDGNRLLASLPEIVLRTETQQVGQKIVSGLAQRAIARLIREWLIKTEHQV